MWTKEILKILLRNRRSIGINDHERENDKFNRSTTLFR